LSAAATCPELRVWLEIIIIASGSSINSSPTEKLIPELENKDLTFCNYGLNKESKLQEKTEIRFNYKLISAVTSVIFRAVQSKNMNNKQTIKLNFIKSVRKKQELKGKEGRITKQHKLALPSRSKFLED
jgi:hypothetical protein